MTPRLLALAAALVMSTAPLAGAQTATGTGLTVSGEGIVDVAPDIAVITLGVMTEGETAAAALRANSDEQARVLAALTAAGVAPRDIQTSGLNLNPLWYNETDPDGRPRISGYQASNVVTVRVRDLEALGTLLDMVVTTGANQLNGLSFGLANDSAARDEARRRAVADALARAQLFAQAAGVKLGPMVSLVETGIYQQPAPMFRQAAEMAPGVPVAGGELAVTAGVTITFALTQ